MNFPDFLRCLFTIVGWNFDCQLQFREFDSTAVFYLLTNFCFKLLILLRGFPHVLVIASTSSTAIRTYVFSLYFRNIFIFFGWNFACHFVMTIQLNSCIFICLWFLIFKLFILLRCFPPCFSFRHRKHFFGHCSVWTFPFFSASFLHLYLKLCLLYVIIDNPIPYSSFAP